MRPSKKEYAFALKYYNEVHHTTLDPEKAGVVRIHLITPAYTVHVPAPALVLVHVPEAAEPDAPLRTSITPD